MTLTTDIQQKIDTKTKPPGSLGQLEQVGAQLCQIQNTLSPALNKPIVLVFAGDHGLALEGVSPYPQEVTWQMVMNFLGGGAAINVFSRLNGLDLSVVDAGVNHDFDKVEGLIHRKVGSGTASILKQPAMNETQMNQAINHGRELVSDLHGNGCNTICLGEMGIGNTSSAALIMSKILKISIELCVGKGAGSDEKQLNSKRNILSKALELHADINSPEQILATFGGFEIAMMVGAILQAAELKMVVVVDGFITTAAVLVATSMQPECRSNCVFSHCSGEQGHQRMLQYLEATAILDMGLRLGEGSGGALAFPLIQAAANFVNEMASFESAGVADKD